MERLHKLRLENSVFNDNVNENIFKSSLDIFNPKLCVPGVVTVKASISSYKSETFCVCQSQQNCQLLTEAGGGCKYCCKYISKIDEKITSTSRCIMKRNYHMHQIQHIHIIQNNFIWYPTRSQEKGTKAQCKASWWVMCSINWDVTCNFTVSRGIYGFEIFSICTIPLELQV